MPIVTVEWLLGRSDEQKQAIAQQITDVISTEASVPSEGVWIRFVDVKGSDWAIGGRIQT